MLEILANAVNWTSSFVWIYCGLVVFGAVSKVELVWAWGDLMNGLQVFPNIVGLIGLSGVVASILRGTPSPETGSLKDES